MLINEGGLVKALKHDLKHGGYNIMNGGEQVTIWGNGWYLRADWAKLPRKALATIVEHMGMIPSGADALTVVADADPQVAMPEIVAQDVAGWLNGSGSGDATMVPVYFAGVQVYQQDGSGRCYGVSPASLAIVERTIAEHDTAGVMDENRLYWKYGGEVVMVTAVRPAPNAAYWTQPWQKNVWEALESVDLHRPADE